MTDVFEICQLPKRHDVTRQQAFSAVGDDLAWRVDNGSLTRLLKIDKEDQNEIMIFVGNRGCVQIFTGQIEKVMPHGEWINVFNKRFTLHLWKALSQKAGSPASLPKTVSSRVWNCLPRMARRSRNFMVSVRKVIQSKLSGANNWRG